MNLAQCEEHDPTTGTGLTLSKWTHLLSHCAAENEQTNVRFNENLAQCNHPHEIRQNHRQNDFRL